MLIAFNKPYGVLSQFTADGSPNLPLSGFRFPKGVYSIGRLDADSEGLLLLSDEPDLNQTLLLPQHRHWRRYWAQVERVPTASELQQLTSGPVIQGRRSQLCRAWLLEPQPMVAPRTPPIRSRGTCNVSTGRSAVPDALSEATSAGPSSSPRSDGLIGAASTRPSFSAAAAGSARARGAART